MGFFFLSELSINTFTDSTLLPFIEITWGNSLVKLLGIHDAQNIQAIDFAAKGVQHAFLKLLSFLAASCKSF